MKKFIPNFTEFVNEEFDNLKNVRTIGMDAKNYMAKQPIEQILQENQLELKGLVTKYFSDNISYMRRYLDFASNNNLISILKVIKVLENVVDNDVDKEILSNIKTIFKKHLNQSNASSSIEPDTEDIDTVMTDHDFR